MNIFKFILLIFIVCCHFVIIKAQNNKPEIDSLLRIVNNNTKDVRLEALSKLTELMMESNIDSALLCAETLLKESEEWNNLSFKGDGLNMLAYAKREKELFQEALSLFEQAFTIRKKLKEFNKASVTLNLIGTTYHKTGDLEKSLEYYHKALEYAEINNDPKHLSDPTSNLGKLYTDLGDYEKAKQYDSEGLFLARKTGNKKDIAHAYNSLGTIFQETGYLDTAKLFYKEALKLYTEINYNDGSAHVYNNMAIIYFMEGDYDESLIYFRGSMNMRLADNDMINYSQSLMNLGLYYQMLENYDSAIYYSGRSVEVAIEYNALIEQKDAYLVMAESYESIKEYKKALVSFRNFILIKDSVMDENRIKNMQELETKYQSDQQKKELEFKDLKIQQEEEEKLFAEGRKRYQFTLIGIGGLAMLLVLLLIGKGYLSKRNTNSKLEIINGALESQKSIIEEKNKNITDSIHYAKKIQEAMLLSSTEVKTVFLDSFILYKPKDIVAGDFYWWMNEGGTYYLAVADCTGHGVPGAMVSVVCANVLNKSVKEYKLTKPSDILDKATDLVIEAFSTQEDDIAYIKDGMDITFCAIDVQDNGSVNVEYSGANNPLWIVRKKGRFEELKADRQPIGYFEHRKSFSNSTVVLEKGDTIYLFSDGYADQFGGEKNKKYKSSNFKNKLLSLQKHSLKEQQVILEKELREWKGGFEQTDDICIIGIRV